jgi:AcrR family transcriptional regulator
VTAVTTSKGRPGRHRSEAADEAILRATLELLAEHGYGELTMTAVIERSAVSSATLYRRYATKQDLVAAAVATLIPAVTNIDTGSLKGDITALVRDVAHSISARNEALIEALRVEKQRNPDLAAALRERFLQPRLAQLKDILVRAKARGEISGAPPAEAVLSLVTGPLHHRAYNLSEALTPAFVNTVISWTVRALGA